MEQAKYWNSKNKSVVQCILCPKLCVIKEGAVGQCRVRENVKGKLYSKVYGKPCSLAVDPIEKKPLYHFLPGSKVFSFGTIGCNLHCDFCQNWEISQANDFDCEFISPKAVVEKAKQAGCKSIAYTYNDPIVFYEYALDIMKIAKKEGIKNIIVCNGFINQEPLKEWCKYIDAANIDLKSFDDRFYRKYTTAWLEPILESIKTIKKAGVWLELTNLIIPKLNDNIEQIKEMCEWIKENVGKDVPLHFSAFYPCNKMLDKIPTPASTLMMSREIALKSGLNYVYVGNVLANEASNTYSPKGKKVAIERGRFNIVKNNIKQGMLNKEKIVGVWK